jgi:hypothetical protein
MDRLARAASPVTGQVGAAARRLASYSNQVRQVTAAAPSPDPDAAIRVPQAMIDYLYPPMMPKMNMGTFHLVWHTIRHWDSLSDQDKQWVQTTMTKMGLYKLGWTTPPKMQEGDQGNGGEFDYMHGTGMIADLKAEFADNPQILALFDAFPNGPPEDGSSPLMSAGTLDPAAKQAMAILNLIKSGGQKAAAAMAEPDPTKKAALLAQITDAEMQAFNYFTCEDALALFVQTGTLRPSASTAYSQGAPAGVMGPDGQWNKAQMGMPGVHNYLHGWIASRQDPGTQITMNDPSVNLKNQAFWGLHGWIESVFAGYRSMYDAVGVHPANPTPPGDTAIYPGGPTRTQEAQETIAEMPKMGGGMKMKMAMLKSKVMAQSAASCALPIPQSILDRFKPGGDFMPHG